MKNQESSNKTSRNFLFSVYGISTQTAMLISYSKKNYFRVHKKQKQNLFTITKRNGEQGPKFIVVSIEEKSKLCYDKNSRLWSRQVDG